MIQLEHISKVYEGATRVEALKDISLNVKEGEIFGIIGQSGAGKTCWTPSQAASCSSDSTDRVSHLENLPSHKGGFLVFRLG